MQLFTIILSLERNIKNVRGKSLNEQEMEEYFDAKPPIVDEFKESK